MIMAQERQEPIIVVSIFSSIIPILPQHIPYYNVVYTHYGNIIFGFTPSGTVAPVRKPASSTRELTMKGKKKGLGPRFGFSV